MAPPCSSESTCSPVVFSVSCTDIMLHAGSDGAVLVLLWLQGEHIIRTAMVTLETVWLIPAAGGTGTSKLCRQDQDGIFLAGQAQLSVADLQVSWWLSVSVWICGSVRVFASVCPHVCICVHVHICVCACTCV